MNFSRMQLDIWKITPIWAIFELDIDFRCYSILIWADIHNRCWVHIRCRFDILKYRAALPDKRGLSFLSDHTISLVWHAYIAPLTLPSTKPTLPWNKRCCSCIAWALNTVVCYKNCTSCIRNCRNSTGVTFTRCLLFGVLPIRHLLVCASMAAIFEPVAV